MKTPYTYEAYRLLIAGLTLALSVALGFGFAGLGPCRPRFIAGPMQSPSSSRPIKE